MLDYIDIITKYHVVGLSGSEIARQLHVSKTGVNDFLKAFRECEKISFPLPDGITNYAIYQLVYGHNPGFNSASSEYCQPDYEKIHHRMTNCKNMTLAYLWNKYSRQCEVSGGKPYQYRQFCELYRRWCTDNYETIHIQAVIAQKMEVDFAGKTFELVDKLTGEVTPIVVFVAILPYSQYIYAEGMISTKEPQWIDVNNNALKYFGGVPAIVVCDNCKQAVVANKDWIDPEINKDYAAWADHNHTAIIPAKVRKPKYKSSVENAVGIMEKGFFHDLEETPFFSLSSFNNELWKKLSELNKAPFKGKEHSRAYYWEEEKVELMPLPSMQYQYMERKQAKVSSDFHVRFDNAYYSVDKAFLHKNVLIGATSDKVRIFDLTGKLICEWPRATHKGQWQTNPDHLPTKVRDMSEWNGAYFTKKAILIGPNTTKVIERILSSRNLEVQTYRLCLGVIGFTQKYSKAALEECCRLAIQSNHCTYSYIKNTIAAVAEDMGTIGFNTSKNDERNKGGFIRDSKASDINTLLSKSNQLMNDATGKEAPNEE